MDFPSSSELIGYVDLTDSYELWPKCSLLINVQKCVRLFRYSKYFLFYALSIYEDPQIFNSPTSKSILVHSHFSSTFLTKGERCMRLSLCKAPTQEEQNRVQPQHRETSRPSLFEYCVGSLTQLCGFLNVPH